MKTENLRNPSGHALLADEGQMKRLAFPTTEVDLTDLDFNMTNRTIQQKKKLGRFHFNLQQHNEELADQEASSSSCESTSTSKSNFLEHTQATRTQPIDIKLSSDSWRCANVTENIETRNAYDDDDDDDNDVVTPSQVASAAFYRIDMNAADAGPRTMPVVSEEPEESIYYDSEQPEDSERFNTNSPANSQQIVESNPAVVLQFNALKQLFIYANAVTDNETLKRPVLHSLLTNLNTLSGAICNANVIQSDATTLIAASLERLLERIPLEAEQGSDMDYETAFQLVVDLNQTFQEFYKWDPEKSRFLGPIDVRDFDDVLTFFSMFYSFNSQLTLKELWSKEFNIARMLGRRAKVEIPPEEMPLTIFQLRRQAYFSQQQLFKDIENSIMLQNQLTERTINRIYMEQGANHVTPDESLEFLWDPEEEDDDDQFDETDDSDTASVDGIFDSATEISGADVTENDWSEIDRASE
ncbi:hypothetical protein BGW37DRAFT_485955 [Umbelopsis sp. PMI_123]|nr:hypothetical protein BGW37DRAFT_485955 [Umbelopsis sp. PMI_123]